MSLKNCLTFEAHIILGGIFVEKEAFKTEEKSLLNLTKSSKYIIIFFIMSNSVSATEGKVDFELYGTKTQDDICTGYGSAEGIY